jgi:threonine/homoserine/homoserine lactone efflux protein
MKIEYHKPTTEDRRRRAGFWLALGSFTSSVVATQLFLLGLSFLIVAILLIRFVLALIGGLCD